MQNGGTIHNVRVLYVQQLQLRLDSFLDKKSLLAVRLVITYLENDIILLNEVMILDGLTETIVRAKQIQILLVQALIHASLRRYWCIKRGVSWGVSTYPKYSLLPSKYGRLLSGAWFTGGPPSPWVEVGIIRLYSFKFKPLGHKSHTLHWGVYSWRGCLFFLWFISWYLEYLLLDLPSADTPDWSKAILKRVWRSLFNFIECFLLFLIYLPLELI